MGNPLVDILVALFALGAFIAMVGRLSGDSPYDQIGAGGAERLDELPIDAEDDGSDGAWPEESEDTSQA